jgi:hypothetical protein
VVNRPYPKLSYKYFGLFQVLERVGLVAYRLALPEDSKIHNVFHVSRLKPFVADYTLVFSKLPMTTDLEAAAAIPEQVLDRRLVKKGNSAIPQVFIKWTGLPKPQLHGRITTCFATVFLLHLPGDTQALRRGELSGPA